MFQFMFMGAAVGEIKIFHSRVMGKKAFTNIV